MRGEERYMRREVGPDGATSLWLDSLTGNVESAAMMESLGLSDEHSSFKATHDPSPELSGAVGGARGKAAGTWSRSPRRRTSGPYNTAVLEGYRTAIREYVRAGLRVFRRAGSAIA